jgi:hypothetical protein
VVFFVFLLDFGTVLEQYQNLIEKYHTVGTVQNLIEKYHTVGTVPKSNRKIPHC